MRRYDNRISLLCWWFLFTSLLFLFPSVLSQSLSPNQTSVMITLSQLLNNTNSPWNFSRHPNPCLWKGVSCNSSSSSITLLSLSGFGISTSNILPVICKIETLESINLSNNRLSSIPDEFISGCGGIDRLKVLNFSKNVLGGSLPAFHGFSGLETLDLSFNSLSGVINSQLDSLLQLKSLNLSFNKFNGSLPITKSMVLEELQLSMNSFQGTIPMEVGNYQNLNLIDLSVNKLSGSIPESIGDLINLKFLILSANALTGEIPAKVSNIPNLFRFAANQNKFSGSIPSGITKFLTNLDLSYNNLSGSIPSDLLSYQNLQTLDLSYNQLDGPIPPNMSPALVRLRLGSNKLNGTIPTSFATLSNLKYLELDNNSLTSVIPDELGSCRSLALLNLAQNELMGPLPLSLGNLSYLEVLRLQLNKLVGEIPAEFSQLKKLSVLNISWNSLNGSLPSSVLNSQTLTRLNLQGNKLSSSIPDTISGMNSLLELQLGENKLSGRIPMMPEKLQIALNLSSNLFGGTIPSTLSPLEDLEVLDLSNNGFSGEIPEFLTQLGSLTQLILTNNQLSGVLPKFNRWVSVNASGNPGLVNATDTESNTPSKSAKKKKLVAVPVILAVASAFLGAGVVTIVVFLFSRRVLKVNDQESQPEEDFPPSRGIQGNLLTANGIHRSNIDFAKAMEAVTDPLNIVLNTRFSTYFKTTMPSGANYFVKKHNWSNKIFQSRSHDKFRQELEHLGKLSNSNVATPLAYVLSQDSAYLFYEYAKKGILFDALHGKLGNTLDWASRYSIAVGVAQGLTFLHGCVPAPILLLDLSSRNIFLKSLKEPQIADIELCKVIDPSKSTGSLSTVAGSVGYIPPEYAYTMRITMAGNVYSFGIVLLELLTGRPAVSEGTELAKWVSSNSMQRDRWDHILDRSISRTSPAVRSQMVAVLMVALGCVSVSPEARPKMKSVLRMILNAR